MKRDKSRIRRRYSFAIRFLFVQPSDASNGWNILEIHFSYSSSSPSINGCRAETVINVIKEQMDRSSLYLLLFANFTLYNETLKFWQIEGPLLWISSLTSFTLVALLKRLSLVGVDHLEKLDVMMEVHRHSVEMWCWLENNESCTSLCSTHSLHIDYIRSEFYF